MLIDQPQFCDHIFTLPDVLSSSPLGSGMQPPAYQPVELTACRPGEVGLAANTLYISPIHSHPCCQMQQGLLSSQLSITALNARSF